MKEQIQALIERYQQSITKIYGAPDDYGAGYEDGRASELESVIEDLKEIIGQ